MEKRGRGRPRKNPEKPKAADEDGVPLKRGRGRPKKTEVPTSARPQADFRTAMRAMKPKRESLSDRLESFQKEQKIPTTKDYSRSFEALAKKSLKKYTEADFKDLIDVLIEQDLELLKEIADGASGHSMIKVMAARVCLKIMATGSARDFEIFLNRLIGKPKETIIHRGDPNAPLAPQMPTMAANIMIMLPSNGKEALSQ